LPYSRVMEAINNQVISKSTTKKAEHEEGKYLFAAHIPNALSIQTCYTPRSEQETDTFEGTMLTNTCSIKHLFRQMIK